MWALSGVSGSSSCRAGRLSSSGAASARASQRACQCWACCSARSRCSCWRASCCASCWAWSCCFCQAHQSSWRASSQALASLRRSLDLGAERRLLQHGEALFQRGEPASHLYQLVVGRLLVEDRTLGPEDLPGGFIELEPWLQNGIHRRSAWAEGSAFLAVIGPAARAAYLRRYPELVLGVLEKAGRG